MFDDHMPQAPAANEPKDLFEDVPANLPFAPSRPSAASPAPAPQAPAPAPAPAPASPPPGVPSPAPFPSVVAPSPFSTTPPAHDNAPRGHGVRTVLVVLASIVVIGVAGFLAYKLVVQPKQGSDDVSSVPDTETQDTDAGTEIPEPEPVEPTPVAPVVKDTDGDGLNDEEEAKYGTDPKLADSDRDGLGDREEIQVYGTDPLATDTDKDGYLDGQEVKSGFNPNGPGKLFEIPK